MKDFNVTLKEANKQLSAVLYGMLCAIGVVCAWVSVHLLLSDNPAERVLSIVMILPALFFLALGGSQLLQLAKKIHLVPQGIAVTLWGRTLVRYPIEEIGMFLR